MDLYVMSLVSQNKLDLFISHHDLPYEAYSRLKEKGIDCLWKLADLAKSSIDRLCEICGMDRETLSPFYGKLYFYMLVGEKPVVFPHNRCDTCKYYLACAISPPKNCVLCPLHYWDVLLSELAPWEREVLELRLGLNDGRYRTLEEVAAVWGITRERVRQCGAKALHRLHLMAKGNDIENLLSAVCAEEHSPFWKLWYAVLHWKEWSVDAFQSYEAKSHPVSLMVRKYDIRDAIGQGKTNTDIFRQLCSPVSVLNLTEREAESLDDLNCETLLDVMQLPEFDGAATNGGLRIPLEALSGVFQKLSARGYKRRRLDVDKNE